MQKKPFMIIVLVLLLVQPLVVVSSMPFAFSENVISPEKDIVVSQGSRLEGEDLTNHVPVLIDEESDFTSQGWPGAGTEEDPWIISGLNITYDVGNPCVEITNIDSYFVLQDCYLGQLSNEFAVHFLNVSHGAVEYITIFSVGYGINLNNANNTLVSHSMTTADNSDGMFIQDSMLVTVDSSYFDGYGLDILDCPNITISNNDLVGSPSMGCMVEASNYTRIISNYISDTGGDGIMLDSSWYSEIMSNTVNYTGGDGMFISSEYTLVEDNTIINTGDEGIEFNNVYEWISILSNQINSSGRNLGGYTFGIYTLNSDNGEISNNIFADDSLDTAIVFEGANVDNYTIADNYFENHYNGFWAASGENIDFLRNDGTEIGQALSIMQGHSDCNIINNSVYDTGAWGIYAPTAIRTNIIGNYINTTAGTAFSVGGANLTIQNNTAFSGSTGLFLGSTAWNAVVQYNTFESFTYAIDVDNDDCTIDSNIILDSANGIDVSSGSVRIDITNNVIDGANGAAIHLRAINQTVIGNTITNSDSAIHIDNVDGFELRNNIIDVADQGLYFYQSVGGVIEDNNMTECGVYFPMGQTLPQWNHSFSGNYVNDKPLYYALNQSGMVLDGNDYGEVILANCSDVSIDGGLFAQSNVAMQLLLSDRIDITNIHVMDQNTGITIEFSVNVTIADSIFSDGIGDEAINVEMSNGFTADNLTMFDINEGLKISDSNDCTVRDSEFYDIDGYAIDIINAFRALVQENTIFNCDRGIDWMFVQDSLITNNDISFCDEGIDAWGMSDNNNVTFNYIHENYHGIRMDDSYSWYIYNNSILWNAYGIYMTTTFDDAWVYNNTFGMSTYFNGFCDGADYWDDHVDGGNYWDDYSGFGVYSITGGSAMDRYPMQYIVYEPIINTPMDIDYAEGEEGNFITWVPFDNNLKEWTVTIEGGAWAGDAWNFENITVNVDGLAYGVHTVFVLVEDMNGNTVNDTVMVTVYDDTVPEIDGPADTWLFEDADDQTISWLVSDLNPNNYTILLDGVLFESGSWTTGELMIDFDGVTEGLYEVNVTIFDVDGNYATDILVLLMIDDGDEPIIDQPDDVMYLEGTTGNTVVWSPEDEFADRYEVIFNGTPYEAGDWSGSRITVNVDGFPVGIYEVTITVFDTSGNFASDTMNVTVLPLIPPEVPLTFDWLLIVLVGAGIAGVVVVVAIIYYMKKRTPSG